MEDSECGRQPRRQNSAHQVPAQHRISIVQAGVRTDQLACSGLTPDTLTQSTRPIQASSLRLNVSWVARTNLIRESKQFTATPNLKVFQNRGLSLNLCANQTRPCVLLTRERDLRLGSVASRYSSMI